MTTDEKARRAAEQINAAIASISGKPLPIKFPNDETAMLLTSILTNAGNVARGLLSAQRRIGELEAIRNTIPDLIRSIKTESGDMGSPLRSHWRANARAAVDRAEAAMSAITKETGNG